MPLIVLVSLYVGLIVASILGWIMNIITIAHSSFGTITGILVLRVIGIFVAPLGSVLGLFA